MSKFFEWLMRNRKPVGYTIGSLNLLAALNYYLMGLTGMAVIWTVMGLFLFWDAYEYK
jgi:hypothetical protein